MVQQRPLAPGRARPREVECARTRRVDPRAYGLDDVRIVGFFLAPYRGRERGDVDPRLDDHGQRCAHGRGVDGRQVALDVDDDVLAPFRVEYSQGLENSVGTGRVVGPRHDGAAADRFDRLDDRQIVRGHQHGPHIRLDRPAPDVHDHRLAMNVGQRLARQAARGEARRNEDDRMGQIGTRRHEMPPK